MQPLSEQEIIRRNSLTALEEMGINPYPPEAFEVNAYSTDIKAHFENNPEAYKNVSLAGRLMMVRDMGKACFAEIQDSKGKFKFM